VSLNKTNSMPVLVFWIFPYRGNLKLIGILRVGVLERERFGLDVMENSGADWTATEAPTVGIADCFGTRSEHKRLCLRGCAVMCDTASSWRVRKVKGKTKLKVTSIVVY
jgi:hypothetical protein